ncbi:MAG: gluconate 2-dehydrogenase subunit 3 family protein [Acidobacteriaceae bacterium]|nr:gluconate 2-dehydrogenase subunit 3 family protein [Acidobacteriaceae bacterium]
MANQSPDRREVLEMLARVAAVSQFPGFVRWAFGAEDANDPMKMGTVHEGQSPLSAQQKPHVYQPQFFTPTEYAMIDQLSELIIPADDTPGARDAGVSEFIDFMTASDTTLQPRFRDGLQLLDARATTKYGAVFMKLPEDKQTELLRAVAYKSTSDTEGRKFFLLVREYTVMGYYTSRIGLEQLDYPGLKLYAQSPACPHEGDPEHKHLPPPRY